MKRSLVLRPILLFVVLEMFTLGILFWFFNYQQQAHLDEEYRDFEYNYRSVLDTYEVLSKAVFMEVINKPDTLSLVARAIDSNTAQRNALRTALQTRLQPTYQNLLQYNLHQLHFHLPDVSSFLRMHRPAAYGDSLVKIRPAVVLANQRREFVSGFEVGRHEAGFRFIFPLFQQQRFVGTVETSLSFATFETQLARRFPGEYVLLIKKSVVGERVSDNQLFGLVDSPFSSQLVQERFLDVLHVRHIPTERIYKLASAIRPRLDTMLKDNRPVRLSVTVQGHCYGIYLHPLTNVAAQTESYLMMITQDRRLEEFKLAFWVSSLVATLLVILLCGGLLLFMHRIQRLYEANQLLYRAVASHRCGAEHGDAGENVDL